MNTTTDLLKAAILDELDRNRPELDAAEGLDSVSVIIHMDRTTGMPFRVLFRRETRRDVRIPAQYRRAG